ncbi:MAG: hypothetical protein KC912_26835 [Proteobacteria bacterium]|nr:hypothetical protein [Pseudomonadota bacterium]
MPAHSSLSPLARSQMIGVPSIIMRSTSPIDAPIDDAVLSQLVGEELSLARDLLEHRVAGFELGLGARQLDLKLRHRFAETGVLFEDFGESGHGPI